MVKELTQEERDARMEHAHDCLEEFKNQTAARFGRLEAAIAKAQNKLDKVSKAQLDAGPILLKARKELDDRLQSSEDNQRLIMLAMGIVRPEPGERVPRHNTIGSMTRARFNWQMLGYGGFVVLLYQVIHAAWPGLTMAVQAVNKFLLR